MVHLAFLGNGRSYHVQKWLPAVAEQGVRVSLLTYTPPEEPLPGVALHVLAPPSGRRPEALSWRDFWGRARPLEQLLAHLGADVLMASYATNYGWMGARSRFRPLIVQTWTYDVSVYPFQGWRRLVFRPLVEYVLRQADAVITDGAALAAFLRARYPAVRDRVVTTRWGIRLADYRFSEALRAEARARWQTPAGAPLVVSPRGVHPWYRPEGTLPGLRRLLDAVPEAHVLVLTLGHEREGAVQADLDALAAHPRAHVLDRFLSTEEMRRVWAAADVLVSVPSHDGVSEAVLEGMYAGVVPVVSDIPSNRSFLDDGRNAVYVRGTTPADLAETLQAVIARLPAYKARIVPVNRRWVEAEASVEQTAAQVADLVRALAAPARTPAAAPA